MRSFRQSDRCRYDAGSGVRRGRPRKDQAKSRARRAAEVKRMSAIAWDGAAFSTVIVRHRVSPAASPMTGSSGRSSIPETSVVETIGRGVLDSPHARGMTAVREARSDWRGRNVQSKTRASSGREIASLHQRSETLYQLLRQNPFCPLILRSIAERDASRRIEATAGPSWFETARHAEYRVGMVRTRASSP